jgi:hypothetical protein
VNENIFVSLIYFQVKLCVFYDSSIVYIYKKIIF